MGRITASVTLDNPRENGGHIRCDALVGTGASHLVLPVAWRDRLGDLDELATVQVELANHQVIEGAVCGPVRIQIEGFRPVYSEVLFVDMQPDDGAYIPLVGYIILEQCQAAVDMVGHRLIHVPRLDLR